MLRCEGREGKETGLEGWGALQEDRSRSQGQAPVVYSRRHVGGLVEERFPHPHPCQQKAQEDRQKNRAFRHCTIKWRTRKKMCVESEKEHSQGQRGLG